MKRKIEFILILFVLAFLSCSEDNAINERIDRIKKTGDKSPLLALTMLDSLNTAVRSMAEGTAMKYDLLKLRLQDKAYITANSDLVIKKLLKYYEEKGTIAEKQEVYYYAGSVYRDLQDTPRAISYFLKSSEIAAIYATSDSTMQKNSYSNLFYLFFHVQDYQNAYKYAYEEYVQSQKIGKLDIISLTHLGDALRSLDSLEQAKQLFVMALDTVTTTPTLRTDIETICNLLLELSFLKDSLNAQRCYTLLINRKSKYEKNQRQNYFDENNGINYALAHYYDMIGDKDSTIYYNRLILQDGTD